MKTKAYDGRTVIADIIDGCSGYEDRSAAIRAMRAVCRYFGGQLVYIPANKTSGDTTRELRGVIVDEVGDADAERILKRIMALFGGFQLYIPMERGAFRDIIAREIFEKYDNDKTKIGDLCREYGIAFNTVYRRWIEGRDKKKQMALDFEEK
jgi:Mor family transcriptional regulator